MRWESEESAKRKRRRETVSHQFSGGVRRKTRSPDPLDPQKRSKHDRLLLGSLFVVSYLETLLTVSVNMFGGF